MKRVPKILTITALLLLLLVVAVAVGLNLYVQSPGAQARIQQQISEALGIPMEITSTSIGLGTVQISGVRFPNGEQNLLEARSFSAEYQLWPLLQRRLEIRKMVLDSPKIYWAQNADGKWVLPAMPDKGRKEAPALPNAPAPNEKTTPPSGGGFQVVLDALEINNGSIVLLDAKQQRIATATDVEMRYSLRTAGKVEGTISAGRIVWQDALTIDEVKSPVDFDKGDLSFPDLRGRVAGGNLQAKASVQTEAKNSPFTVELTLTGVDLARLSAEGGWQANQAGGTLAGKLALKGEMKNLDRTEGQGELALLDGKFKQLNLFQTIGQVLQIPELSDLRVRTGQANFRVNDEKTYIDHLVLETPDLQFSTKGNVRFDGKLTLDAQLAVSPKLATQLPGFVRENFSPPDAAGRVSIAFDITGKTDRPKTNLMERVIGQRISGQFNDLLSGLFPDRKEKDKDKDKDKEKEKEEKKKKKKEEEEKDAAALPAPPPASPAPAAGPAPATREP